MCYVPAVTDLDTGSPFGFIHSSIRTFIHSVKKKYSLSVYYVAGTIPGTGDTTLLKANKGSLCQPWGDIIVHLLRWLKNLFLVLLTPYQVLVKMQSKWNSPTMLHNTATLEKSLAASFTVIRALVTQLSNPTPRYVPKRNEHLCSPKNPLCHWLYWVCIQNHQQTRDNPNVPQLKN